MDIECLLFYSISLKNLKANGTIVFLLVHPYFSSDFCVFVERSFHLSLSATPGITNAQKCII